MYFGIDVRFNEMRVNIAIFTKCYTTTTWHKRCCGKGERMGIISGITTGAGEIQSKMPETEENPVK